MIIIMIMLTVIIVSIEAIERHRGRQMARRPGGGGGGPSAHDASGLAFVVFCLMLLFIICLLNFSFSYFLLSSMFYFKFVVVF